MKLKLIKDNEVVISREEYEEYKTIYYRYNNIVTSILNKRAVYKVYGNKKCCDVAAGCRNYQLPIKRFNSPDPEYNRVCAEELCELLNQEQ